MTLSRSLNVSVAKSFEHAIELLFGSSFNPKIGRYRSNFVFRGLGDRKYELLTSLQRLGGDYAKLESSLIRNFRKYAETVPHGGPPSNWHWIAFAQHHGLPTRIMDWTWSPLVALHFATADLKEMNKVGRVWCLDSDKLFNYLPPNLIADLRKDYAFVPTVELLDVHSRGLRDLDALQGPQGHFVLFFEPPSMDQRIVNQYALFSVMPGAGLKLEDWLANYPDVWKAVDLPKDIKWEIRDKLDNMNMNERVLFPGVDGLSSWLKRHYSPGPPIGPSQPKP